MVKSPKHYCITWVDAESWSRWHNEDEIDKIVDSETYWVEMTGWILYEDRKFIVLSTKRSKGGFWGNVYKIPKAWVVKKRLIEL